MLRLPHENSLDHPRVKLFMDFAHNFDDDEVPDPYYGLGHGFDLVLDMVEDASQGLVENIRKQLKGLT